MLYWLSFGWIGTGSGHLLVALVLCAISFAAVHAQEQSLPTEPLVVETADGPRRFAVEVARTPEQRAVGLMGRRDLAPDRGMLFDFGRTREVAMWMKNTFVPLDILFIDPEGRIVHIAENTTPQSLKRIPSGGPVRFALELLAGTSERLGISPGNRVRHPLFEMTQ